MPSLSVESAPSAGPRSRLSGALWVPQVLLAVLFLSAGASKLLGAGEMVAMFGALGFGQWFRYLTGAVEVAGALLLLVPGFAAPGALLLAATMAGATATHLFLVGGSPVPALVLGAVAGGIAWGRRAELRRFARR